MIRHCKQYVLSDLWVTLRRTLCGKTAGSLSDVVDKLGMDCGTEYRESCGEERGGGGSDCSA